MATRHLPTRGFSTGSSGGTVNLVVTRGYAIGAVAAAAYFVFGPVLDPAPRFRVLDPEPRFLVSDPAPRFRVSDPDEDA